MRARPLRARPSGTRPTGRIRGILRPSTVRVPFTRTTKIPISDVLDKVGERIFVPLVAVLSDCRHDASQVIFGTVVESISASDNPPHASWYARVCGVGARP